MGGWMRIIGYCSSGFNPWPSGTAVIVPSAASMRNGLTTNAFRIRKNVWVVIRLAVTMGIKSRSLRRLVKMATEEYVASSQLHSSSEPSCPPHHAENLYAPDMARLLYCATYEYRKSPVTSA